MVPQSIRQSPDVVSQTPMRYKITRRDDFTLQWDPPVGSRQLVDALSYHYPMQGSLPEMMREAIDVFLRVDRGFQSSTGAVGVMRTEVKTKHSRLLQPATFNPFTTRPNPPASDNTKETKHKSRKRKSGDYSSSTALELQILAGRCVWDSTTGMPAKRKGRNSSLDPNKRKKIAQNRGNVCGAHRRSKTTVIFPQFALCCS